MRSYLFLEKLEMPSSNTIWVLEGLGKRLIILESWMDN